VNRFCITLLTKYYLFRKTDAPEEGKNTLWRCLAIATKYRLVPFYVLVSNYKPAPADKGMMSTHFPLSILPADFDQFLAQEGIAERPLIALHDLDLEATAVRKLERVYERALTRMLLHFLLKNCMVSEEQTQRVLGHTTTRRNFAQLIGCPRHTDEAGYNSERVQADCLQGPLPSEAEEACAEYYGHQMRCELILACDNFGAGIAVVLGALGITAAQLRESNVKFERSKTRGYGAIVRDEHEPKRVERMPEESKERKREEKEDAKRIWREAQQPRRPEPRPAVDSAKFERNELVRLRQHPIEPKYDLTQIEESTF
jgi:hypothetical protein